MGKWEKSFECMAGEAAFVNIVSMAIKSCVNDELNLRTESYAEMIHL